MKPRSMMIVVLALVFGGASAMGVRFYLLNNGSFSRSNRTTVVMTAADMPRGRMITADQLTTRDYERDAVPEGALTSVVQALDRAVEIPMIKGEPVLEAKLAQKGAGRGLAALVPKGMRAVTIQTPNVATGVAGLIMPGNKVDVMLTVNDTGGGADPSGGGSATTLLQRVEILAVDQRVDGHVDVKPDAKEMRSVTLLVTPQQANLLDLGQNKGTLHLSLRNPDDSVDSRSQPVTLADLRYRQEKPWDERVKGVLETLARTQLARPTIPKPPPPAAIRSKIRTIRGVNEGSVYIESPTP